MTNMISALTFLLVTVWTLSAGAQESEGSWKERASGFDFVEGGCASDGTYLYTIGGGSSMSAASRYDPVSDSWLDLPPAPALLADNCLAVAKSGSGTCLFSFGNYDGSGAIYRFDLPTKEWTLLRAELGVGRSFAACATLDNRVYIIGGTTSASTLSDACEVFDPETGTIAAMASIPAPVTLHGCAAVAGTGKVFVAGGLINPSGEVEVSSDLYEFDPAQAVAGTWTRKAPLPDGRYQTACFGLKGKLYVTGGADARGFPTASTVEWDPVSETWASRADCINLRTMHGAAATDLKGYVYGGNQASTSLEEFTAPEPGTPPPPPPPPPPPAPELAPAPVADEDRDTGFCGSSVPGAPGSFTLPMALLLGIVLAGRHRA